MKIKITRTDGKFLECEGDVSYNEAYVEVRYVPDNGDAWVDITIPWHAIIELEMRP